MSEFVICIDSESNTASLIVGKVYRILSDAEARIRVLDEGRSHISILPPWSRLSLQKSQLNSSSSSTSFLTRWFTISPNSLPVFSAICSS